MDVSVIIINYNTLKMTDECVDSIFQHTYGIEFEVILVDNASNDGSKNFFTKNQNIKYIYNNENLGFGRANNIGLKYATGKYVFFLNSDTILLNNAILGFWEFMENNSKYIACCGCKLIDAKGSPTFSGGCFPNIFIIWNRIMAFCFYEIYKFFNIHEREQRNRKLNCVVDFVSGADLFVRKEVLNKCGSFDPDFFMYYEETEMQYRFFKFGYKSVLIDTPKIKHFVGSSNVKKGHSLKSCIIELRSRFLYCKKTMSTKQQLIVRYLHLLMIPRILVSRACWIEKKELINLIIKNI